MMSRLSALICLFLGIAGGLEASRDARFVGGVMVRNTEHRIEFERDGTFITGTSLSESELDLDNDETVFEPVVRLNFPAASVTVRGSMVELDGSTVLSRDIFFQDVRFAAGSSLKTEIDIDELEVLTESLSDPLDDLSVGWMFGLHFMDLEAQLSDGTKKVHDEFTLPWFTPGAKFRMRLGNDLALEGNAQVFGLEVSDKEFLQLDTVLKLRWEGLRFWDVELGWDYRTLEGASDDFEFEMERTGPFVGLYVAF